MESATEEDAEFGQLFMIDTMEAKVMRFSKLPNNSEIADQFLFQFDKYIMDKNPYVAGYIMMKEELEKEAKRAKEAGEEPREMKLLFSLKEGVKAF